MELAILSLCFYKKSKLMMHFSCQSSILSRSRTFSCLLSILSFFRLEQLNFERIAHLLECWLKNEVKWKTELEKVLQCIKKFIDVQVQSRVRSGRRIDLYDWPLPFLWETFANVWESCRRQSLLKIVKHELRMVSNKFCLLLFYEYFFTSCPPC